MKKSIVAFILSYTALTSAVPTFAQDMNMYVNDQPLVRDVVSVEGFDMLPILNC